MNNILQLLFNQKMKQIPQGMLNQLEQQLKRANPQAYQEFQKAKQNNEDPNEYLNKVVNNFNNDQKEQWNAMMGQFQQQEEK